MSYGIYKEGNGQPVWNLKGYQADKKPLYHLEQLQQNRTAKVLIVEGEKTADQAFRHLKDVSMVCVTWCGGASAVNKTDWTPLYSREIIIWPDNDEAGFKAATEISSQLRKVGVQSLKVVTSKMLNKHFPAKWDLADPLPDQIKLNNPFLARDFLFLAKDQAVSIGDLFKTYNYQNSIKKDEQQLVKFQLKEVLWRVEERLRPQLEEKHKGASWEINDALIKKTIRLFNHQGSIQKCLQNEHGIQSELNHKLSYQVLLQEAKTGKELTNLQIQEMKKELSFLIPLKNVQPEIKIHVEQQILAKILESGSFPKNGSHIEKLLEKETELVKMQ